MTNVKPLKRKFVISVLERNGFKEVRSRKHTTFKKYLDSGEVLTTWIPHHAEISVFVINYIIKQTKKPKEEFWD
jgi:predicted RNA binding protein YcfA (HicA-like mRNA interferase family)